MPEEGRQAYITGGRQGHHAYATDLNKVWYDCTPENMNNGDNK